MTCDETFNLQMDLDENDVASKICITASRLVVLTHQPEGLPHEFAVPKNVDLTVYGDVVCIKGPLELREKTVRIHCRRLEAQPLGDKGDAAVVVDGGGGAPGEPWRFAARGGEPGDPGVNYCKPWAVGFRDRPGGTGETADPTKKSNLHGQEGAQGGEGHEAGSITITCDEYAFASPLTLSAIGGPGGKGAKGQQGGKGGHGGHGAAAEYDCGLFGHKDSTRGGNGGRGGDGGRGGRAGRGGRGGNVTFIATGKKRSSELRLIVKVDGGADGVPGDGGDAGEGGDPGEGGAGRIWYETRSSGGGAGATETIKHQDPPAPRGESGPPGGSGPPGNPPDFKSSPGEPDVRPNGDYKDTTRHLVPSQLEMSYQQALQDYLGADWDGKNNGFENAKTRLEWLQNVLRAMALEPEKRASATTLASCVGATISQLGSKTDYFGFESSYAPLASHEFYQARLEQSLEAFKSIEASYSAYFTALREKTDALSHLKLTNQQAEHHKADLRNKINHHTAQLDALAKHINELEERRSSALYRVQSLLAEFSSEVEKAFNLNVEKVLNVLQQLAFLSSEPGFNQAAMITSQAGMLIDDSLNDLQTAGGQTVKKELLIHKVSLLGRDVKDLREAFLVSQDYVTVDDPNGHKLLATQQTIMKTLDDFFGKLPSAEKAEAAVKAWVNLVTERNAYIMRYNSALSRVREMQGQIAKYDLQEAQNEALMAKGSAPNLPEISAYVSGVHKRARDECLRDLCLTNRACEYWSLNSFTDFSKLMHLAEPSELTGKPSAITSDVVVDGKTSILSNLKRAIEDRGHPSQPFPDQGDDVSSILVIIDEEHYPGVIEALRENGSADVTIDPARADSGIDENPFARLSNVRLTKIRAWLDGATTSDNMYRLELAHSGVEQMVNSSDEVFYFSHGELPRKYIFRYSGPSDLGNIEGVSGNSIIDIVRSRGIKIDGNMAEKDRPDTSTYALVGPFTTWRIDIPQNENRDLDVSKLRRVILEFHGSAYAFD